MGAVPIKLRGNRPKWRDNMNIEQVFRGLSEQIMVDFEQITSQIKHNSAKGHIRETLIVESFLRKYLPNVIGIAVRGEVVSLDGQVSPECDIILYESRGCPPFIKKTDYCVFPVELVYGIIEVKSKLDKRGLEDGFKKITKLKRMPKRAFMSESLVLTPRWYGQTWEYFAMAGFLFAYDSIDLKTIQLRLDAFQKDLPLVERVDSVWVSKKNMVVNREKSGPGIYAVPSDTTRLSTAVSRNPLLSMVALLQRHFQVPLPRRFDMTKYLEYVNLGDFIN